MVTIKNLSKSFGKNKVLQDINLQLEGGKIYGIVGKNGSGKTTLFRCIAGLVDYDGVVASDFEKLKDHLGLLYTNPILMSRITGWEYLKLLTTARGIKEDDFDSKNIFDLPLNQYAETYSTGMKKKLALMGILQQKNSVFILDEPFNGVDIQSNIIIAAIINQLRDLNKTIIISSHIFSILSELCDEIHLLSDGTIAKTVQKKEFSVLDQEMKSFIIGDALDGFELD